MSAEDGYALGQPYADAREPGRLDVNGVEWWACDPYPTWFRWEEVPGGRDILHTYPARWADLPPAPEHVKPPEDCYGNDDHHPSCDGIVRAKWSGVGCKCGARWYCA